MRSFTKYSLLALSASLAACSQAPQQPKAAVELPPVQLVADAQARLDIYHPFDLTSDLSHLSERQRHMVKLLIEASEIMDDLFWQQAYGASANELLDRIANEQVRQFAAINYRSEERRVGKEHRIHM